MALPDRPCDILLHLSMRYVPYIMDLFVQLYLLYQYLNKVRSVGDTKILNRPRWLVIKLPTGNRALRPSPSREGHPQGWLDRTAVVAFRLVVNAPTQPPRLTPTDLSIYNNIFILGGRLVGLITRAADLKRPACSLYFDGPGVSPVAYKRWIVSQWLLPNAFFSLEEEFAATPGCHSISLETRSIVIDHRTGYPRI